MTARKIAGIVAFNVAAGLLVIALAALAAWQMQRRAWKLDLMARIEARTDAAPVDAPIKDRWAAISAAEDEYRRVIVSGRWLESRPALVKAVTEFGSGYWVMSALAREDGTTVLINRGFVSDQSASRSWSPPASAATVIGKVRLSEPDGGFLRNNDPALDRWFSRDVSRIAASRGLATVAPYFVDAERGPDSNGPPVPGLTVVKFSNNHLVYALTWATLAVMGSIAAMLVNLGFMRSLKSGRAKT